jgi:hypothetical protein
VPLKLAQLTNGDHLRAFGTPEVETPRTFAATTIHDRDLRLRRLAGTLLSLDRTRGTMLLRLDAAPHRRLSLTLAPHIPVRRSGGTGALGTLHPGLHVAVTVLRNVRTGANLQARKIAVL